MSKIIYHICGAHDGHPICFSSDKHHFLDALQKMQPLNRQELLIREAKGEKVVREITAEEWLSMEKRNEPKHVIKSEIDKLIKKYKDNENITTDLSWLSKRFLEVV